MIEGLYFGGGIEKGGWKKTKVTLINYLLCNHNLVIYAYILLFNPENISKIVVITDKNYETDEKIRYHK